MLRKLLNKYIIESFGWCVDKEKSYNGHVLIDRMLNFVKKEKRFKFQIPGDDLTIIISFFDKNQ